VPDCTFSDLAAGRMTTPQYILRSLLHYRFAYLGVFVGAILGATVLLGALFAGDSVGASLRRIGENRTGRATHVVTAGDRFFRQELAGDVARVTQAHVAPVMYARSTVVHSATGARANQVQFVGVTDAFWQLAPRPAAVALNPAGSGLAINTTLARRLGIAIGDTLILRLQRTGILAGNAPVAGAESTLQTIRGSVEAVVDDDSFGRFSLETTQVPQPSVFLPIRLLQEAIERPAKANLLLIEGAPGTTGLRDALSQVAQLADYGLTLRWIEGAAAYELASDRIFIDPPIADAVRRATPAAEPVLSYLVNEFRAGDRTTPYSIATATTPGAAPFLPRDLSRDEVVLNDWIAGDLQAGPGDEVRLSYYQAGAGGALIEQSATFRVRAVIPLAGLAADRAWMPDFPGISDVDTPGEWDPGLPLDLNRIRDKDERYWDEFRGAPKAFLSLEAGRTLWSTRWGETTALRIATDRGRGAELERTLLATLQPEMNQMLVRDIRAGAEQAAESPVDFAGLFIGMSFFLIAAALGLVAMLFQLTLLQRNRESALLAAVGLPGGTLLRWRLAEGAALLLLACAAGMALAMLYTRGILHFLEAIWAGQDAGSTFVFAARPASIVAGTAGFLLLSLLAIWLAIRKQARRTLSVRLAAHAEEITPPQRVRRSSLVIAGTALVIAAAAIALSGRALAAQGAFYIAGFALLAAGIATCRWWTAQETPAGRSGEPTASRLGGLNLKARRARSVTVVGLIATAVFMVLSVASFRKHIGDDWLERGSGTGGFAFWVETTAALNPARDGRASGFEPLDAHAAELGEVVALRAGVGDNINCFNLNTSSQPRLLGVDAAQLAARNAFQPKTPDNGDGASGWEVLRARNEIALAARASAVASESDRGR
jgi:putative ABC transport system permease protein